MLDLVLSTYPGTISDVSVDREFSDHCLVSFNILSTTPVYSSHPPRKIYLYNKANFHQLKADMCSFQQTFLNSQPELLSVNRNWTKLKESLMAAVDRNVLSKVTSGHRCHPPWLAKSVRKLILRRDRLAKAAKKPCTQIDREKYRKARNAATSGIQDEYQKHLNNVIGNGDSDPRAFYRFIKSRRTDTIRIPSLKSGDKMLFYRRCQSQMPQ